MSVAAVRMAGAFVEIFGDDRRLQRTLASAQRKLRTWSATVAATGRQLAGMSLAIAAPFALSTRTFASFEQSMSRVRALTGASEGDFQRLSALARELGSSTVFSATQAAEAMQFFALAGYDVDRIMSAMPATLNLAAAGQVEVGQAADIAAKVMAGMGISASELENSVDVLAKAMTSANTDILQLGDAFKFVGPMAKTAGVSLEEITAGIQLLSNASIQGEMAGTTLRGMILSLTSPSAEAAKELERLQVDIEDLDGNMRPLVDIIADLDRGLEGVGSARKLRSLGTIFPARQAAGAAELVALGADAWRDAIVSLQDSTGRAAQIAGTQLDNLAGDVTIARSALEELQISIGEALSSRLRAGVSSVTEWLVKAGDWVKSNQGVVVSITKATVVVGGLGVGLMALGLAGKATAFVFGVLATATGILSGAVTFLLSPVGLVTAGLAALGVVVLRTTGGFDDIGNAFRSMGERFQATWEGVWNAIQAGDLEAALKIATTSIEVEWYRMLDSLASGWESLKRLMQAPFSTEAAMEFATDMIGREMNNRFGLNPFRESTQFSGALDDATRRLTTLTDDAAYAAAIAAARERNRNNAMQQAVIDRLDADTGATAGGDLPQITLREDWNPDEFIPDLADQIATRETRIANRNNFDALDARSGEGVRAALNAINPADQKRTLEDGFRSVNRNLERMERDIRNAQLIRVRRA